MKTFWWTFSSWTFYLLIQGSWTFNGSGIKFMNIQLLLITKADITLQHSSFKLLTKTVCYQSAASSVVFIACTIMQPLFRVIAYRANTANKNPVWFSIGILLHPAVKCTYCVKGRTLKLGNSTVCICNKYNFKHKLLFFPSLLFEVLFT